MKVWPFWNRFFDLIVYPEGGKWTFSIKTEKIVKSISSALYLSIRNI